MKERLLAQAQINQRKNSRVRKMEAKKRTKIKSKLRPMRF